MFQSSTAFSGGPADAERGAIPSGASASAMNAMSATVVSLAVRVRAAFMQFPSP